VFVRLTRCTGDGRPPGPSLHYMNYNFARPHATLTKDAGGYKVTPAMAAGVERRVWTHRDIAALLD
jgi:hypothetical protein